MRKLRNTRNPELMEKKYEKLALKGYFLEDISNSFEKYIKGEPRKAKYSVTYFEDSSEFNSAPTESEIFYRDLAKEFNWEFVASLSQMNIFVNYDENPIPFETDEREKFENYKKCTKKSIVYSNLLLIVIFLFQILMRIPSILRRPVDFLKSNMNIFGIALLIIAVLGASFSLISYFLWCKKTDKAISNGKKMSFKPNVIDKYINYFIIICVIIFLALGLLSTERAGFYAMQVLFLAVVQFIFVYIAFLASKKIVKRANLSKKLNYIITVGVVSVAIFAYIALIMFVVFLYFSKTEGSIKEIDGITAPLTINDLYDINIETSVYFEKEQSIAINLATYYESNAFEGSKGDKVYTLEYEIVENKLNFLKDEILESYLKDDVTTYIKQSELFGATTYEYMNNGVDTPTGEYVIMTDDKLVYLDLNYEVTDKQIEIIKEKLRI